VKFISLFSGIGGLDLGLERAGHECVLQVENNEFCQRVLEKHWPDVPRIADVHDVTAANTPETDMVVGGFPCQPVSVAGKQLGVDDERWLWPEFERIIGLVRPRYVIVENVPGLFLRGFDVVLSGLASLGYDAEWSIVSACSVGASHKRERVFIVGYPDSERQQESWHVHAGSLSGARGWGLPAPDICRTTDGLSPKLDRLKVAALGNAVVPQVAELIGRRLMELETARSKSVTGRSMEGE
jgi:DNA (cytosine-5)-methyltransferase 1